MHTNCLGVEVEYGAAIGLELGSQPPGSGAAYLEEASAPLVVSRFLCALSDCFDTDRTKFPLSDGRDMAAKVLEACQNVCVALQSHHDVKQSSSVACYEEELVGNAGKDILVFPRPPRRFGSDLHSLSLSLSPALAEADLIESECCESTD